MRMGDKLEPGIVGSVAVARGALPECGECICVATEDHVAGYSDTLVHRNVTAVRVCSGRKTDQISRQRLLAPFRTRSSRVL